jgi:hypothetical protein
MNQVYKKTSIMTLIIIILITNHYTIQSKAQEDVISYEIEAQEKLIEAFVKISLTEKKGVDIANLTIMINESSNHYNTAKNLSSKDVNNAINNYSQSINTSEEIINFNINAALIKIQSTNQNTILLKFITTCIIILASILFWYVFSKYYMKIELNKKIELK